MNALLKQKDLDILRKFIPINTLAPDRFNTLISGLEIEEYAKGAVLFEQGDEVKEFVYLISGMVGLYAGEVELETVVAGSEAARFAIAHQIPRRVNGVSRAKTRIIRVPTYLLDEDNKPPETNTYLVEESADEGGDWMTTMLQSPVFQRLPAANLQKVMMQMEEISFEPGETVVKQGDSANYYYIIKNGDCDILRQPTENARAIKLAELHSCDSFGEDALLSGAPRNVTVQMKGKGQLLRLSKANFIKLVKEPVLQYVDFKQAQQEINQGATWLDVRSPDDFQENHIGGSVNIPFFSLRMKVSSIQHDKLQILVCEEGRTSEAAAFLLLRFGFNALILKGGIASVSSTEAEEPLEPEPSPTVDNVVEMPAAKASASDAENTALLDDARLEIAELEKICAKTNESLNKAILEADELRNQYEKKQQALSSTEEKVELFQQQIDQLQQSEVDQQHSEKEVREVQQNIVRLNQQLEQAQTERELFEVELNNRAEKELELASQVELKQQHIQQIEKNVAELNQSLKVLQQEHSDLNAQYAEKEQHANNQLQELDTLQKSLLSSKKVDQQNAISAESKLAEVEQLNRSLKEKQSELESALTDVETTNQQLLQQSEAHHSVQTESEQYRSSADEKLSELQRAHEINEKEKIEVEQAYQQITSELDELRLENKRTHEEVGVLQNSLGVKADELSNISIEKQAVIDELENLSVLHKENQQELDSEIQELTNKLHAASGDTGAQLELTKSLESELSELRVAAEIKEKELGESQLQEQQLSEKIHQTELSLQEKSNLNAELQEQLMEIEGTIEAGKLTVTEDTDALNVLLAEHKRGEFLLKEEKEELLNKLGASESLQLETLQNVQKLTTQLEQTHSEKQQLEQLKKGHLQELEEFASHRNSLESQLSNNVKEKEESQLSIDASLTEKEQKIRELTQLVETYEQQNALLEGEKTTLQAKLATLETALSATSSDQQVLAEQLDEARQDSHALKQLDDSHKTLKGQHEESLRDTKELREALERAEAELSAEQQTTVSKLAELNAELNGKTSEIDEAKGLLEQYKQQKLAAENKGSALSEQLSSLEASLSDSTGKQGELSRQLDEAREKEEALKLLDGSHQALKMQHEKRTRESEELREALERVEAELASEQQSTVMKLDKLNATLSEKAAGVDEAQGLLKLSGEQKVEVESQNLVLSEKLNVLEGSLSASSHEQQELNRQLVELRDSSRKLQEKLLGVEGDYATEKKLAAQQISELNSKLVVKTSEAEAAMSQVELARVEEVEFQSKHESLQAELVELQSDSSIRLKEHQQLTEELQQVSFDNEALKRDEESIRISRDSQAQVVNKLENELTMLNASLKESQVESKGLNDELAKASQEKESNASSLIVALEEKAKVALEWESRLVEVNNQLTQVKDDKNAVSSELERINSQFNELSESAASAGAEQDALQTKVAGLELSMEGLGDEKVQLISKMNQSNQNNAKARVIIQEQAQEQVDILSAKLERTEQENQSLKGNVSALESKVANTGDQQEASRQVVLLQAELDRANSQLLDMEIKVGTEGAVADIKIDVSEKEQAKQLAAVRSELQLVREQTESDVIAMKTELDKNKRINMALQKKLIQFQYIDNAEAGASQLAEKTAESKEKKKGWWK